MKAAVFLFTILCATMSVLGCSQGSQGSAPATSAKSAPLAIDLEASDLSGTPSGFSGNWSGTCSVTGPGAMPQTCSIYLNITQDSSSLGLETGLTIDGRKFGPDSHELAISVNSLLVKGANVGQIGVDAFTYTSGGSTVTFLRTSDSGADFMVHATNVRDADTVYQAHLTLGNSP